MLGAVRELAHIASKLVRVFSDSPDSICLADRDGKMIAVNQAFEHTVGASAEDVFRPSVLRLVKDENRPISILQVGNHGEYILVTGVPIFDQNGDLELLLSNARLAEEIEGLYAYVNEKRNHENQKEEKFSSESMIMQSQTMRRIKLLAEQIKDTDATILITGPSGVGKGVLARDIHKTSCRFENPMVEINCGAIPENLLESELFGYASGAFTGANANGKEGLIEAADGGTLFLDEIGEMPLALQVKLLKVIQDKQIQRIGAMTPQRVDVRIIAATNRDLPSLVRQGKFREDLYYRLNVIPIEIPPLKERKEDIEAAVKYFVEKFARKYRRSVECTKEFLNEARNYEWPGNMRELENCIERAVLTSKDGILYMNNMEDVDTAHLEQILNGTEQKPFNDLQSYMEAIEGKVIRELYKKYHSSYKVAEQLGVSQTKAYRLIKKYCMAEEG